MNFIKRLFKNFNSDSESKGELNNEVKEKRKPIEKVNELDFAWELFKKEEFEKAIEEAEKYIGDPNIKIVLEAKKVIGLSLFRQTKYSESELIFQEISEKSKNPDDWFNLTTSATLNKNIELSDKAFDKAIELYKQNGTRENLSIPNMHCYYMQGLTDIGKFEKAFIHFKKMKEFYGQYVITDSHFLYMRGMPFFEHFLESSEPILKNINLENAKKELIELKSKVDEYGKELVTGLENKINAS
ncbi:hypothetical protein ACJRPK_07675 [Aquimarina sp. 2-A2]|uniref:hypothetical protein n=1 Tax=Aquimarina sp. 2-A2 TaxID=3382644 RepID=UPI00387F0605